MTEDQFVGQVLAAGLDAAVIEAEAGLARAASVGVGRWPNPSIQWERQPNPTEDRVVGGQHTIVPSIPLVLSGRLGLEADAAARTADAAEARRDRARAELRAEATLAFASVIAAGERHALLERFSSVLDELARIIGVREESGDTSGYDLSRISLEREVVADQVLVAANEERAAVMEALRLLGPDVAELPKLAGALAPLGPSSDARELLGALEEKRSDLGALRLEKESAELAKRAAGRAWIPDPTIGAGALLLEDAQHDEGVGLVIGVSIPFPLFDQGQGPRARAEAERSLAASRYQRLLHTARAELLALLDYLSTRKARLQHHRDHVVTSATNLRTIATAGYKGGGLDLLELMDAERSAREAEQTMVRLSLEVREAETRLSLLSGAYDNGARWSSR